MHVHRVEHAAHRPQAVRERVDGVEDDFLVLLHVLVVRERKALQGDQKRCEVADDPSRLAANEFEGIKETIQKVNTYELPEILAYRVDQASSPFGEWISRMTDRPKRRIGPAARTKNRRSSPSAVTPLAG